jgi:hypothetical protein
MKPKYTITIKGTLEQVISTKEALAKLYADDSNHFTSYDTGKPLENGVFTEVAAYCQKKFSVIVKRDYEDGSSDLSLIGRRSMDAKRWLMQMLPDIVKLNFPEDWKSPLA